MTKGIYDPEQSNDRLLLGFMGTMSEGRTPLAAPALARWQVGQSAPGPTPDASPRGPWSMTLRAKSSLGPDDEVREAVRLVFDLFTQHGSALAVVTHFTTHRLRFPTRLWGGSRDGELGWNRLSHAGLSDAPEPTLPPGPMSTAARPPARRCCRERRHGSRDAPAKANGRHGPLCCSTPIRAISPGRGFSAINSNSTTTAPGARMSTGAPYATARPCSKALCAVAAVAAGCLYVTPQPPHPTYECNQAHPHQAARTCQALHGDGIDAAVTQQFLEVIQPAHLEVSLATLDQLEARAPRQVERQWQLRLERAQYEADAARRHFFAVEAENRLVARSLEHDWNEKLAEVDRLGREAATARSPCWAVSVRSNGRGLSPWRRACRSLGRPDDHEHRTQTAAALLDQGCDADQTADHVPSGHSLADRGVYHVGAGPSARPL